MGNGGTFEQAKAAEDMMLGELAWLWPIGALAAGAIVAVALAMFLPRERQRLVGAWAAGGHLTCAALAAGVWLDRGFRATMSDTVLIDGLALALAGIVGIGGAVCVALAAPAVQGTDREGEFYAVLTFASLCCVVLGAAADAALVALAIAALGLATFILTGYQRGSTRANEASIKYYIFGTVTGAVMVYGFSWWFGQAGHDVAARDRRRAHRRARRDRRRLHRAGARRALLQGGRRAVPLLDARCLRRRPAGGRRLPLGAAQARRPRRARAGADPRAARTTSTGWSTTSRSPPR